MVSEVLSHHQASPLSASNRSGILSRRYLDGLGKEEPGVLRAASSTSIRLNYAFTSGLICDPVPPRQDHSLPARAPLDVAISCYTTVLFKLGNDFTNDLMHFGQYYKEYQRLMAHWSTAVLPTHDISNFSTKTWCVSSEASDESDSSRSVICPGKRRACQFDRNERTRSARQVSGRSGRRSTARQSAGGRTTKSIWLSWSRSCEPTRCDLPTGCSHKVQTADTPHTDRCGQHTLTRLRLWIRICCPQRSFRRITNS